MIDPAAIRIEDYSYDLPAHRIAHEPLPERDASKLMIYRNGEISEDIYRNLCVHLPKPSLLMFNNTRVINARILFQKPTGSQIEIFCLEPEDAHQGFEAAMSQQGTARWKCLVGGISKWKEPVLTRKMETPEGTIELQAQINSKGAQHCDIQFNWQPQKYTFAEVLSWTGYVPLPPYIKRAVTGSDKERYQTAYAQHQGSVAAPTAGLHFTDALLKEISSNTVDTGFLTLHVGAGTFKPVTARYIRDHEMHGEWLLVNRHTLEQLMNHSMITAVGTTSLRTMETLYWLGVKVALGMKEPLTLHQWEVYHEPLSGVRLSLQASMKHLLDYMETHQLQHIYTQTHIMIVPGYTFRTAKELITNFHQPQSTLLLLVAAAIGDDWKRVYEYALNRDYRFLSYGDGSLLYFNQG
jgi:S-adenosylmethionine:tRNA ribosyltransferase-isomerase